MTGSAMKFTEWSGPFHCCLNLCEYGEGSGEGGCRIAPGSEAGGFIKKCSNFREQKSVKKRSKTAPQKQQKQENRDKSLSPKRLSIFLKKLLVLEVRNRSKV